MCGITGYLSPHRTAVPESVIAEMTAALMHRGPDDGGVWMDRADGVGLGHRRLAVVDLSHAGHQPMVSDSGRYILVYNGEVYNYNELRNQLEETEGCCWRGRSDTEILLTGIQRWGLEVMLKKCYGMFALALWDRSHKRLFLARDRLGEKPLYYGMQNGEFLFASELKALKRHPAFAAEIDRDALHLFLRHNYIPAPHSIYKGIYKLLPGTVVQVDLATLPYGSSPVPYHYWSLTEVVERCRDSWHGTEAGAAAALEKVLGEVIELQMMADVDLGTFLSGGIDSSAVTAVMQSRSTRPVQTFSLGFMDDRCDESPYARAVADYLGTDHTELIVTPEQALEVIPDLPGLYDEPFADSSQIPTFLLARLTRGQVTVSLSGDGGDELFGGYDRYFRARTMRRVAGLLPKGAMKLMAESGQKLSPALWNKALQSLAPLLPGRVRDSLSGDKMHKLFELLGKNESLSIYHRLVSHWQEPQEVILGGLEPVTRFHDGSRSTALYEEFEKMMLLDTVTYLPDDILVKLDRAAMAVGLETRMPLLDHRLVEFVWSLPLNLKIRNGTTKWLLRQVLYKYVPRELVDRPKMGFMPPIDEWLRGPLREWAETLLSPSRLKSEGYFHSEHIRQKWQEHLIGERNWQYQLWDILMFQSWLESQ